MEGLGSLAGVGWGLLRGRVSLALGVVWGGSPTELTMKGHRLPISWDLVSWMRLEQT